MCVAFSGCRAVCINWTVVCHKIVWKAIRVNSIRIPAATAHSKDCGAIIWQLFVYNSIKWFKVICYMRSMFKIQHKWKAYDAKPHATNTPKTKFKMLCGSVLMCVWIKRREKIHIECWTENPSAVALLPEQSKHSLLSIRFHCWAPNSIFYQ